MCPHRGHSPGRIWIRLPHSLSVCVGDVTPNGTAHTTNPEEKSAPHRSHVVTLRMG
jgi:hypothetical protein